MVESGRGRGRGNAPVSASLGGQAAEATGPVAGTNIAVHAHTVGETASPTDATTAPLVPNGGFPVPVLAPTNGCHRGGSPAVCTMSVAQILVELRDVHRCTERKINENRDNMRT